ncbi:MAG: 50S ribosomal protein L20 [Chloroflexota bacterium]|nr:50S ribosomal protein L20 [Chloroflexota bacterium]MDE2918651.1 50S ribosomal protein L20 [Chloroflexota bacterium]
MARVKRGVTKRRRHKKVLKAVRGHRGARSRHFRAAHEELMHARQYAYRDRRARKRQMRRLWIMRINAGARLHGLTYSTFIRGLQAANVTLDRKALADLAANEPEAFEALADTARAAA